MLRVLPCDVAALRRLVGPQQLATGSGSGALLFFFYQKNIKEFVFRYSSSLATLSIIQCLCV
jgi:hypothetical protein